MDVTFATEPVPGRENEDHVLVSADFSIVLDGVTELPDLDSGCRHGPRWYVQRLGARIADALSTDRAARLDEVLAEAIDQVCRCHAGTCDLTNPNSPSATVAIVRHDGAHLDYLVLCDSSVVVQQADGIVAVTDDRTARLPAYDRETVAGLRNRPGGFWVASTAPEAAGEALTGTVATDTIERLLLCTDGVSRLVEYFGWDWREVFRLAAERGPRAVLTAVRACETDRPEQVRRTGRRTKPHDDATLIVLTR